MNKDKKVNLEGKILEIGHALFVIIDDIDYILRYQCLKNGSTHFVYRDRLQALLDKKVARWI